MRGFTHPLEDGAARASEVALVNEDVTWEAEAGTLNAIVGSSEDAITSMTLVGVLTSWNPGARRLYGYSTEEAIGRTVWEVIGHPLGPELVLRNIERVKRGEVVGPFDAVHHDRDGRPL